MSPRGPADLLPLRVAMNDFRAIDTDVVSRWRITELAIKMLVAADGVVHEYLEMVRELEEAEDALEEARAETAELEDELEGLAHPDSDEESVAAAVRDEHDLCHEDPWIACRHACCREASRLVA